MKCPNCGNDLESNAKFCDKCGTTVKHQAKVLHQGFKWKDTYSYITIAAVIVLAAIIGFVVRAHKSASTDSDSSNIIGYQDDSASQRESEPERDAEYQTEPVEEEYDSREEEDTEVDSDLAEIEEEPESQEEEEIEETPDNLEEEKENYILPDSDSRYLNKSELEELTADELRLARNELYARHGRIFQDESLRDYFSSLDWYEPTIEADDFEESMLNDYELANRDLIVAYEEEMGY